MRSSAWDWTPVGFEEDPTPGTVEAVESFAVELRATAERLWHQSETVRRVHGTLVAPSWSGVAAEVFAERMVTVMDGFRVAASRHSEGADAARSWAGALWETQEAADRALQAAEEAQADLALAEAAVGLSMAGHTALPTADIELIDARFRLNDAQLRLDDARAQARRAKDQYDAAEQAFVRQLDATLDGALAAATRPELEDFAEVTIMLTAVSHPASAMDLFTSQGPDQVRKLLAVSPDLAQTLWDSPPPPEQVASWWKQLSPEEREKWCQAVPSIIGNLPGLDADTRIHANMIQFQRDLYDGTIAADSPQAIVMQDILKALRVNEFSGPLLDFEKLAKELTPPRGLLSYNIRHEPPLAAIAIGETSAEKSGKVTWAVPGMDSALGEPDRLTGWTGAALNIYKKQKSLERGISHMVVAWIGYDSPDLGSVLHGDRARDGAARLSHELDGQWAADTILGGNKEPHTAVVGHSYGTTVVTNAVSDVAHNVQSVVLLASAGVEGSIHSVDDLHVDGGGNHVYASEASRDNVAGAGRIGSGRSDPRDSAFGAREFSSEGDPAHDLRATDGHDTIGYGTDNGPWYSQHASKGHGYLNPDTEALHNTAASSLGLDGKINGGTTDHETGKKR